MDSTRLEMFIPVSFPVEVILSSVLRIVEQEMLLHCVFRTTSFWRTFVKFLKLFVILYETSCFRVDNNIFKFK